MTKRTQSESRRLLWLAFEIARGEPAEEPGAESVRSELKEKARHALLFIIRVGAAQESDIDEVSNLVQVLMTLSYLESSARPPTLH